jgi:adenylosuccinate synthase
MISKLDILNGMENIPVCNSYDVDPVSAFDFFSAKPKYISLPGWDDPRRQEETCQFLNYIQDFTNCRINYISCGTKETDLLSW